MPRPVSKTHQSFSSFASHHSLLFGFILILLAVLGLFALKCWEMNRPRKVVTPSLSEKIAAKKWELISNDEWKQVLPSSQYKILREGGTETAFTGKYLHETRPGTYVTADCGIPVFRSEHKYDSKTGWPSFWAPANEEIIEIRKDDSLGMPRFEIIEKTCGSHLGHVFDDGPEPSGKRFCVNSEALKFIPDP